MSNIMSQPHWLVWLHLAIVMGQMDDHPYCSLRYERLCQGKGQHVGCQFPYLGHGDACENYTAIIFSDELKYFILHYINRRRQRIASGHERVRGGAHLPKPQLMMLVQWDRELAFLAQRLADQCRFMHDDCRATVRYPYAGQTVGEVRWRRAGETLEIGARRSVGRVLDAWWGERRRVQVPQLTAPFVLTSRGAVWGHFSQLAVWSLRAMGCGAVHHGTSRPRLLLVCDFSHTNMLGQRTLAPGPPAPCPRHTVRIQGSAYPSLCAPVPDFHEISHRGGRYHYDEYETAEEEVKVEEIPRMRNTRPFSADPEEDLEVEAEKEVQILVPDKPRAFESTEMTRYQVLHDRQGGVFREKINRELDMSNQEFMNKAAHKMGITRAENTRDRYGYRTHNEDMTRVTSRRRIFYNVGGLTEDIGDRYRDVIPIRKQTEKPVVEIEEDSTVAVDRATQEPIIRHRWKQTRNRPRRPGANALLNTQATRRHSKASLLIDQDDAEQLFRDTGFIVKPRRPL